MSVFKRFIALCLAMVLLMGSMPRASASEITDGETSAEIATEPTEAAGEPEPQAEGDDLSGKLRYKGYLWIPDGNSSFKYNCPGIGRHTFDMMQFHYVVEDGVSYVAYCINPGKASVSGDYSGSEG